MALIARSENPLQKLKKKICIKKKASKDDQTRLLKSKGVYFQDSHKQLFLDSLHSVSISYSVESLLHHKEG